MKTMRLHNQQQGAALVVGLILLVVITVLAISGMNTATTELAMARNDQNFENAFQAAETGLEQALAQGLFSTTASTTITQPLTAHESVTATIDFEDSSPVPDKAFSLGAGHQAYPGPGGLGTGIEPGARGPTRTSPPAHRPCRLPWTLR